MSWPPSDCPNRRARLVLPTPIGPSTTMNRCGFTLDIDNPWATPERKFHRHRHCAAAPTLCRVLESRAWGRYRPKDTGRSCASTLRGAAPSIRVRLSSRPASKSNPGRSRAAPSAPVDFAPWPVRFPTIAPATLARRLESTNPPPRSRSPADPEVPSAVFYRSAKAAPIARLAARRDVPTPPGLVPAGDSNCCRSRRTRGARAGSWLRCAPLRRAAAGAVAGLVPQRRPPEPARPGAPVPAPRVLLEAGAGYRSTHSRVPDRPRRLAPAAAENHRPRENADAAGGSTI